MSAELLTEIIKQVVTIAGYVSAIFGAGVAVLTFFTLAIKPLRKGFANWITHMAKKRETENALDNLKNTVLDIKDSMNDMKVTIQNNANAHAQSINDLKSDLSKLDAKVLENEADRLRSELFDCGNRCRRGIRLHPEEMIHIIDVFEKYSTVLKQNGTGKDEYHFICDYYNHQDFPPYHELNKKHK